MIGRAGRHEALLARHPELFDAKRRVLEVGACAGSIARYLERDIVGVDRDFADRASPHLTPVRASVLRLPFADGAFDDVVCGDALLYLRKDDRPRAVAELVRVASKRVFIALPAGTFAASGDAAYAQHLARTGAAVPDWLGVPLAHGIPQLGDVLEVLLDARHALAVYRNEGIIQHYAGLLAESAPFMGAFLRAHDQKFSGEAPLRAVDADLPYSYLFVIDKTAARPAAPDAARPLAAAASSASAQPGLRRFEMFAIGHRADRFPAFPGIRRILAGAGSAPAGGDPGVLRDDVGPSIADRNSWYSEMTAIYWVWRNVGDLDAVGFCHYRRYFDFRASAVPPHRETYLRTPAEVLARQDRFADRAIIERHLAAGAMIVARPMLLDACIPEQYMLGHLSGDYLAMVNQVLAHHPDYAPQLVAQARDRRLYGTNMFVIPWPEFDRLCRFWFDCLFGIEKMLETKRTGYQGRVLAFLSERIFDLHVRRLRDSGQLFVEYPIICLHNSAFPARA